VFKPFWSPDSRNIAFGTQNRLMRVSISGGPPIKICDTPAPVNAGFWTADQRIVFGTNGRALQAVSAGGGIPKPVTELAEGDSQHAAQDLLPDGKNFIYLVRGANPGVYLRALDAKSDAGGRRLLSDDTSALYAPPVKAGSGPGRLVFVRGGTLLAQPFDVGRLELLGDPVPLAQGVPSLGGFSVSPAGILAYGNAGAANRQLTWYDRKGLKLQTVWNDRGFNEIELAPDESRVAAAIDVSGNSLDTWVYEFARKAETQITTDPGFDAHPVWSPDGQRLVYYSNRDGATQLFTRAASGADAEQLLAKIESVGNPYPQSWSRDGRFLLYEVGGSKTGRDLIVVPMEGGKAGKPSAYLNGEANEAGAQFSPDGHFVAYVAGFATQTELYVRTFPDPAAGKWTISSSGGFQPRWRRDGKELFYFTADGRLMSVEVKPGPAFGVPQELFQAPIYGGGATNGQIRWDVTANGQKFLINTVAGDASTPLTVVLNWQAGL